MKFVLASTFPLDKAWRNYLSSPGHWLVFFLWCPFGSMTFWRHLEMRASALLGACGKAFVASMLRSYLASKLANFNVSLLLIDPQLEFQKTRYWCGMYSSFVGPFSFSFPKWPPSPLWKCRLVCLVGNHLLLLNYSKKLEAPYNTHISHPNSLKTSFSSYYFSTQSSKWRGVMWYMFEYCGPCVYLSFESGLLTLWHSVDMSFE